VLTVTLVGDIDHHGAVGVRSEIDEEIARHRPAETVIVLNGIDFMDSSGIGLVMGRYRNLQKTRAELHITGTSPNIYKVFRLSGIEKLAKLESR
jgi:stage II sporulation protein AA (anti-sigma F factor antagonist)